MNSVKLEESIETLKVEIQKAWYAAETGFTHHFGVSTPNQRHGGMNIKREGSIDALARGARIHRINVVGRMAFDSVAAAACVFAQNEHNKRALLFQ